MPPIPTSSAIRRAVAGWSPVIITTPTPARCASATAGAACGRGGSIMPTTPARVRSCSRSATVSGSTSRSRPGARRPAVPPGVRGARRRPACAAPHRSSPPARRGTARARRRPAAPALRRPRRRCTARAGRPGAPLTTSVRGPVPVVRDQDAHPLALGAERRGPHAGGRRRVPTWQRRRWQRRRPQAHGRWRELARRGDQRRLGGVADRDPAARPPRAPSRRTRAPRRRGSARPRGPGRRAGSSGAPPAVTRPSGS